MSREIPSGEVDEDRIRKQMEKRYEEREGLLIHLVIFVCVNVVLWMIWWFLTPIFPWPLIITLSWGSGMFAHWFSYYNKYGPGSQRREAAIEREIQRHYERRAAYEKPKHDQNVRLELTEDGEIEEIYDDEDSQLKHQRR